MNPGDTGCNASVTKDLFGVQVDQELIDTHIHATPASGLTGSGFGVWA
jgi:hypothetical protein